MRIHIHHHIHIADENKILDAINELKQAILDQKEVAKLSEELSDSTDDLKKKVQENQIS